MERSRVLDCANAPAHKLFERVTLERKDKAKPARDFADYAFAINKDGLPAGVTIIEKP
ncbi:MAG: hypothetical protein WC708_14375 [Lentisphaeria bacterium]